MAQDSCQLCFRTGSSKLSRQLYRYQETNQAVSRCNVCMIVRSPYWRRYRCLLQPLLKPLRKVSLGDFAGLPWVFPTWRHVCVDDDQCHHQNKHVFRLGKPTEEHQGVKKKYASQLKMPKWSGCIVSFIQNPIPGGLQAMRQRANGVEVGIVE